MKGNWKTVINALIIYLALGIVTISLTQQYLNAFPNNVTYLSQSNFSYVIIYIMIIVASIVVTTIIVLLFRKSKKLHFSRAFLILRPMIFFIFLSSFIPLLFALIITVVLFYFEKRSIIISDAINIGIASVIALLGMSLGVLGSELLIAIIAAYDFISVFITGHMIRLAKSFKDSPQSVGIILAGGRKKKHLFLGNGDLAFPNLLVSSMYFATHSVLLAMLEEMVGFLGLLIILLGGKENKGYPVMAYSGPLQLLFTNLLILL